MSLVTTCVHCGTSFNITAAQLHARAGQARCGRCSKVFDAYDRLTSSDGSTLPARPVPKEEPEPQQDSESVAPAQVTIMPAAGSGQKAPDTNGPRTLINPFVDDKKSRSRKKSTLRYEQMVRDATVQPRKIGTTLMGLGAILLTAALLFQVLYYFRDAIVAHYPQSRPAMEGFCSLAQCRIGFLKKPDLLSIEASSLEADQNDSQVIVLRATLRNRAPFPQAFPALDLTLNDIKDQPVARHIFMPNEYRGQHSQSSGIEANAELAVQIRMQLINIKAQGYRLYLFYPRQ